MLLTTLDLAVIVAYFAGLSLMGLYFSKRQTSEETYFVGNRRMPWLLVGVSVMATLVSTVSYVSLPGEMIRNGIGYFTSVLALFLVVPAVNRLIIPALMRLPVTSVYQYYETRFGGSTRTLAAVVFIVMRLVWIGLIIYTASFAVAEMTGWSMTTVILLLGVITTFYTTIGGAEATIWSGFLQGLLLMGGALFIPVYVALKTGVGPWGWWDVFSQAGRGHVPVFSFDPSTRVSIVGIIITFFCWHLCTHGADQVAAQRYLSTSSVRSARSSVWVMALSTLILMSSLMFAGLAVFFFYWQQSGLTVERFQEKIAPVADAQMPAFIAGELPSGVSGLLLAALLAAAMSSLSGGMNSVSSVVTTDFFDRFRSGGKEGKNVAVAMTTTIVSGALGIGFAFAVTALMSSVEWNLVDLIERINHLFVAPLGGLFFAGVLFRRVGAAAALIGFAAGVLTSFLVSFSETLFSVFFPDTAGISFMWIMPASFIASLGVSYIAGRFLPPPTAKQLAALRVGEGE